MGFKPQAQNDGDDMPAISEINVTPFVDVVLVLLVIFMVTAPMIMKDAIGIALPKAASSDEKKVNTLSFAITQSGNILINGELGGREEVTRVVKDALASGNPAQAMISADKKALHGDVVRVIDWVKSAGLSRFAIQIERERNAKED